MNVVFGVLEELGVNFKRIAAIAANVFREVFRDRVLYLTGIFTGLLVLAILFLREVSVGTENKMTLDVGMAAIGLLGLVVTVFVGTSLINQEIEKRTALILIAKPMSRAEFIVGKHLGLSAVLAVLVALMTLIFLITMSAMQFQYPLGSLLMAVLYLTLELSLLSAVAIVFGVFTSSLVATLLTFAVYFMGHFSQNLVTLSRSVKDPGLQNLIQGIYLIFPDLSRLDLKNQAVYGLLPDGATLLVNAVYGLIYIIFLLTLATIIFANREF